MSLTCLQIGSWNIEHLSREGGRKESPYALADHIEMAGIEILALQEVYDTSPPGGRRRSRENLEALVGRQGRVGARRSQPGQTSGS